jgi:hypothetical protein
LWDESISYISGASGNIGMVNITSSTSQTFLGEKRYYISGNVEPDIYTGSYSVQFGYFDWILKRLGLQPCHCHSSSHVQHALYLETILVEQDLLVFCKGLKYY